MSGRKKKPHRRGATRSRPLTQTQKDEALVRDTADIFTCSSQMTHALVEECDDAIADVQFDRAFNQLAFEMWRGRPGHVEGIAAALADLLAARERYLSDIKAVRARLADLMAVPHDEHLHPVEDWLPLVRKHIIDDLAS